jgi:hypothetical protein
MKSMLVAVGIILLFFAASVQVQTMAADQKGADVEKTVKAKVKQVYSTLDSLKAEAYVKLWSRDKIMGELGAKGLENNLDTLLKNQTDINAGIESRKSKVLGIEIHNPNPEMAFAFSEAAVRIEFKNGNIRKLNAGFITVWAKEAGEWKLVHIARAVEAKP